MPHKFHLYLIDIINVCNNSPFTIWYPKNIKHFTIKFFQAKEEEEKTASQQSDVTNASNSKNDVIKASNLNNDVTDASSLNSVVIDVRPNPPGMVQSSNCINGRRKVCLTKYETECSTEITNHEMTEDHPKCRVEKVKPIF